MFNHQIRLILVLSVLGLIFIGLASVNSFVYTGNAVQNPSKPPLVAALFKLQTDEVEQDVLYDLLDKEDANIVLEPIDKECPEESSYLFLRWNKRINTLSIYMRKIGFEDSNFEILGPDNKKIASGKLESDFKWYTFDLSDEDLDYEYYAIFNYGPAEIKIDKILGDEMPESKSSRLMGILTEGFV